MVTLYNRLKAQSDMKMFPSFRVESEKASPGAILRLSGVTKWHSPGLVWRSFGLHTGDSDNFNRP